MPYNYRSERSLISYLDQYRRGGETWVINNLIGFRGNFPYIKEPTLNHISKPFINEHKTTLGQTKCYEILLHVLNNTFHHLTTSNMYPNHHEIASTFKSKLNKAIKKEIDSIEQ